MIWILTIPAIIFFTFQNLLASGFPEFHPSNSKGFLGWVFMIFVGCFLSLIISLVPIGVGAFIGGMPERHGIKDKEYALVALRERDGMKGQFYFLGAGSISDVQYYFWYRQNKDGSVAGGKTTRDPGVRIYQGDDGPKMVTFKTEYVNKIWNKLLPIIGLDMRSDDDWFPDFYIPKGSIKEGYSL